jgi:hypothetical protein
MNITAQIAKQFKELHYGGNWTGVNIKDTLAGVTLQEATTQVHSFNTIATLVFHMNYYIAIVIKVLQGEPLSGSDKYSFDHEPILTDEDWKKLQDKYWADAEKFAALVELIPEHSLWETFIDEKYGSYYRNLHGIIEHCHYHLGQIVLIKKMIQQTGKV